MPVHPHRASMRKRDTHCHAVLCVNANLHPPVTAAGTNRIGRKSEFAGMRTGCRGDAFRSQSHEAVMWNF